MNRILKPKHLKKGDLIGIVSPSAPLAGKLPGRVSAGLSMLKELGFEIKLGKHALETNGYTAGRAKDRASDINEFFSDKKINGIFNFIGGDHSNQLLQYIDFQTIKNNPKVFMGYSDATVMQLAFLAKANLTTFYGPAVLAQFAENPSMLKYTREYFEKAVMTDEPVGKILPSARWTDETLDWFKGEDRKRPRKMKKNSGWVWLAGGAAKGPIIGGCLSSLMHLRGTEYWPDFNGAIMFLEIPESEANFKKGESLETVDACLTDLELMGAFKMVSGMVFGRPFGYSKTQIGDLAELIVQRTKKYHFPVLFNVDIGHSDPIITVPQGVIAAIDSKKRIFMLSESGTK